MDKRSLGNSKSQRHRSGKQKAHSIQQQDNNKGLFLSYDTFVNKNGMAEIKKIRSSCRCTE